MMHISRCTSLKNDETTKRSWTAASAFLILMIVCFHLSFSSSFFFLVIICAGVLFCVHLFFSPAPFTSNIACVFNARYKRVHLRYQLAGWVRMRTRMGVRGATRNVLIHFVCSCRSWENECVEKLHRRCICLSWKLLACFTLCLCWVFWSFRVRAIETDFFCISISISLFPFALSVVFFWRREVFLLLLIFFGRLDAGRDAFISRIDTVPLLLGRCPYSGWTRSWEWKPVDSVQKPG